MLNPISRKRLLALILLLVFSILAGCGQKGDLYLPTEQPEDQPETQDQKNPE